MTPFTTALTSFFSGWPSTPEAVTCMYSSMTDVTTPRIARPVSHSRVLLTVGKRSSITCGARARLKVHGRHFWAITPGWRQTTEKCTECGLRPRRRHRTNKQTDNQFVRLRLCEWVSPTFLTLSNAPAFPSEGR